MSSTSLKRIAIPKLNAPNFGTSIKEAFENIDLNFQKLSNLSVNQGAPGRSCVYIPINLGAAFVFNPYTEDDRDWVDHFNKFQTWQENYVAKKLAGTDWWDELVRAVERDFKQFRNITGYDEHVYARFACTLIWGNPSPFGFNNDNSPLEVSASSDSLAGALHDRYKNIEGPVNIKNENTTLYGNWLYELYNIGEFFNPKYLDTYYDIFVTHSNISPIGKLIVAFSPDSTGSVLQPVGSFEYWYIDPRYRCGKSVVSESATSDISCVLRWESYDFSYKEEDTSDEKTRWNGSFKVLEIFPTIRIGEDGKYYWFINGLNTGVPVQGEAGRDGRPGQMVVVERIENVLGWNPSTAPNGTEFSSPKPGKQTVYIPTFSGIPSRAVNDYRKKLSDNVAISADSKSNVDKTFVELDYKLAGDDYTGRISQFTFTENRPWLSQKQNEQFENFNDISYLYRIFRIVGREKFWTYDPTTEILITKDNDEWDRAGDPSCDEFYFGRNGVSEVNTNSNIQALIKELDGALAIVLPGPAYLQDRTDTSFWFATLRRVKLDDGKNFMLVAYCSPHTQQTTQIDEHSQLGMMMGFDAYTYKSTSDNRNKPRGLVLPIGAIEVASETPSDTWAAHFIHSDTGGFSERTELSNGSEYRGIQSINEEDRKFANGTPRQIIVDGKITNAGNLAYSGIIRKRILHIGSVDDIRTLNYAEDLVNDNEVNGAIPGRKYRKEEGPGIIGALGSANFFGKENSEGWFEGSEVHVDEPVTITRYRDLKRKGRLLTVEGDTIIGPQSHKNIPSIRYGNRGGGLWVASTLTSETIFDNLMYAEGLNPDDAVLGFGSPFSKEFINGEISLEFEPFIRSSRVLMCNQEAAYDSSGDRWRCRIGRWGGSRSLHDEGDDINNRIKDQQRNPGDNPLFSAVFDDSLGARLLIAEDGFVIYNPGIVTAKDGEKEFHIPFSVDAFGNIQTYGREIRSNSFDTAWYFHTKWDPKKTSWIGEEDFNDDGKLKYHNGDEVFDTPAHNNLVFVSSHEIQYAKYVEGGADDYKPHYWRSFDVDDPLNFLSNDACDTPLGYYHTFGFATCNSVPRPTFAHISGNSYNWGATDYLPTVISMPSDLAWIWGGALVTGINPRAFKRKFDGGDYGMRAGGTIKNGLFIPGSIRTPIKMVDLNLDPNFDAQTYNAGELSVKVNGVVEDKDPNDTLGITDMFSKSDYTSPISLWACEGAVIEKSMIVGGEMLGHKSLSVRGQARAKSFRRHKNSYNSGSPWAFMLDTGLSSRHAPILPPGESTTDGWKKINFKELINWSAKDDTQSPIVLDLGAAYGPDRLVKFGVASAVRTNLDDDTNEYQLEIKPVDENGKDREIILVGANPFESRIVRKATCYLYKKSGEGENDTTKRRHKTSVTAIANSLIATVSFNVAMDAQFTSRDENNGKPNKCYGFLWDNQNYTEGIHDDESYGQKSCVCDGFNWGKILGGFPKPPTDQYVFINSLYAADNKHNWNVHGTNAARDRQYGVWFRLTTDGRLEIAAANCQGAMCNSPQNITLTFTYPALPESQVVRRYLLCYTTSSEAPDPTDYKNSLKQNGVIQVLNDLKPQKDGGSVPNDWFDASEGKPYLWIKRYVGRSTGSNNNIPISWDEIEWDLWKSISPKDEYKVYYLVSALPSKTDEDSFPHEKGSTKYITPILENGSILKVLCAGPDGNPQYVKYTNGMSVTPCRTNTPNWSNLREDMTGELRANDQAKYMVVATTGNPDYINPHTNLIYPGNTNLNDLVNWKIYLSKDTVDGIENWLWGSSDGPNNVSLQDWLFNSARRELLSTIKYVANGVAGTCETLNALYGSATLEKIGNVHNDEVFVSMIVTAYKGSKDGANHWSHRSINFIYMNRVSDDPSVPKIRQVSSYIIGEEPAPDPTVGMLTLRVNELEAQIKEILSQIKGEVESNLYMCSTLMTIDSGGDHDGSPGGLLSDPSTDPYSLPFGRTYPYMWIKTIRASEPIKHPDDERWNTVGWKLYDTYIVINPGGGLHPVDPGSGGGIDTIKPDINIGGGGIDPIDPRVNTGNESGSDNT